MVKGRTILDFEIIWKKINHKLTEEEEFFLSQWLNESPSHQQYFDKASHYFDKGSDFTGHKTETEQAWKILKNKALKKRSTKSFWIKSLSVAAAIFVIVIFLFPPHKSENGPLTISHPTIIKPGNSKAVLILNNGSVHDLTTSKDLVFTESGADIKIEGNKLLYTESADITKSVKYNTLIVPRGGEFFLQLSDGTKIWLNSETTLRYPVQFIGGERKVELTGEAFFEVARNEKVPFLVESKDQTVKVLGTEFNISSYKENPLISTTLIKGSIEVFIKDKPDKRLALVPNEQSTISKIDGQISKRKVNPYQYIAWKEGRFVFDDQSLCEIMKTLSKWYNIDIVFAREEIKNFRFTGNLQRYSDLGEMLKKIQKTNEVEFTIENKQITIR
jgi:transmembrane sensor